MLKFLVDVNVPKDIWLLIRQGGFSCKRVQEVNPAMKDVEIIDWALKEKYIVITCDKDFANLYPFFPDLQVIIFDAKTQETARKVVVLRQVMMDPDPRVGVSGETLE